MDNKKQRNKGGHLHQYTCRHSSDSLIPTSPLECLQVLMTTLVSLLSIVMASIYLFNTFLQHGILTNTAPTLRMKCIYSPKIYFYLWVHVPSISWSKLVHLVLSYVQPIEQHYKQSKGWKVSLQSIKPIWKIWQITCASACPIHWEDKRECAIMLLHYKTFWVQELLSYTLRQWHV